MTYCHRSKIFHRDLRPENLQFQSWKPNSPLKVVNFATARSYKKLKRQSSRRTKIMTPYYVAPEALCGPYDEKSDIWSWGVILYIMLSGLPPFNGSSNEEIFENIQTAEVDMSNEHWFTISNPAKALIRWMLAREPENRPTAAECLKH